MVKIGTSINDESLKTVTGGTGIIGMENYSAQLNKCPKCGGINIALRDFIADDGVSKVPGQLCSCGFSWTIDGGGNNK